MQSQNREYLRGGASFVFGIGAISVMALRGYENPFVFAFNLRGPKHNVSLCEAWVDNGQKMIGGTRWDEKSNVLSLAPQRPRYCIYAFGIINTPKIGLP